MFPEFIRNMADDLICDPKDSTLDYLFSSIKIGDWCVMDDYKDMNFEDYLNMKIDSYLEWKDDVINKLPSDPFEMNISGGCTMIRGCFQEADDDIGCIKISEKSTGDEISVDDANGLFLFDEKARKALYPIDKHGVHDAPDDDDDSGAPHDAFFFALSHLGIRDLLSVEGVCKSLRDGVRDDPLLWRNIIIYKPSFELFTDDSLLRITSRANGSLQSLSLITCFKITNNGLKSVFQQNQGLIKLNVAGCIALTAEGLIDNMKSFSGIKRLRIGGLNITMDRFQELNKLLSINNQNKPVSPDPRFFHGPHSYLPLDDNRLIDIELCPQCHKLNQVYDCPLASCWWQQQYGSCRGCTLCIPRCSICGCCLDGGEKYIETLFRELICLECVARFLRHPDGEDGDYCIYQQARYHVCFR